MGQKVGKLQNLGCERVPGYPGTRPKNLIPEDTRARKLHNELPELDSKLEFSTRNQFSGRLLEDILTILSNILHN